MSGFRLHEMSVGYPARRARPAHRVLEDLTATAEAGELTVLIGPNGAGKSTLLRTLTGLQPPLGGGATLDGTDIATLSAAKLARRLAVVLTERDMPPLLTAREVAGLGRYQHTGLTGRLSEADADAVTWALDAVGALHLADRQAVELSDGERQRVLIARALAQEPSAIVLDEPTAFLDVTSRVTVMGLLRRLAVERALAVIVSTHDLELALRIADRVWLVTPDRRLHSGTPEELTLDGSISAVFDGVDLAFDPVAGVFTPRTRTGGTVRVTADGLRRALVERALTRHGWRPVTSDEADLTVTADEDGYLTEYGGRALRFTGLAALTAWSRTHSPTPPEPAVPAPEEPAPAKLDPAALEAAGSEAVGAEGVGTEGVGAGGLLS
ncbi:ABC transporter ATP-binding protein [Actinocorallia sp. A-T 12471]|uniref:ABC transporter ATP-binding protein n=1 Tax=Actinocorallia sp. A-T 12471 TaxID=3089813 RepID=UPI0029CEBBCB|nr:ABC transporter ATP-binding protein [Actinocorallia sp. A-T 12471]MDX6742243.1 ABC transporter ATP-binding protein [Actinocorallia sp. A-T 12471]